MPETIRTFIAFELPDDLLSALVSLQAGFKKYGLPAKWVRPEGIHLTLKFLGNLEVAQIDGVARKMIDAAQGFGPLSLRTEGVGVFPHLRRPRVLWAGLTGEVQRLSDLQHRIDAALSEMGFKKEKRSFKGHLTLGRFKARPDSQPMNHALEEFAEFETETFSAEEIILFKSELNPRGSIYSKLKHVAL